MSTLALDSFQMYSDERGDGEPLLLLHGGTGIGDDWMHVFTNGDPAGFRLIVPDFRAHGRSTLAMELYRSIPESALWVVPNGGHGPIFGALAAPFVDAALSHLSDPL
jgi:pimeloyl-ACP methyl ester carboxylesterase